MSDLGRVRIGLVWTGDASFVTAAEAAGVDSLWVGGHIAFRNPSPEPVIRLAQLAALTTRVTIGTSIVILPLYMPAVLAKQVGDLDRMTGGRVVLGIGVGGDFPPEFSACQVPLVGRGQRADEAIGVIRRLWTGAPVDHDGPLFPMQGVRMEPTSSPGGPPIVVAGRQPVAMRRAAALGDGWMPYLYSPRRYAASRTTIEELAAAAGRDLTGFEWMSFSFVHVDGDGGRARRDAADILSGRYGSDMTELLDRVAVVGDPDEVAGQLDDLVAAGARHLVLAPLSGGERIEVAEQLLAITPALGA